MSITFSDEERHQLDTCRDVIWACVELSGVHPSKVTSPEALYHSVCAVGPSVTLRRLTGKPIDICMRALDARKGT